MKIRKQEWQLRKIEWQPCVGGVTHLYPVSEKDKQEQTDQEKNEKHN
jgi:hypothetical protein